MTSQECHGHVRHSCGRVEDPHRIYESDKHHMKQYPKKVLVDIWSQNRKKCQVPLPTHPKFHDQTQGIGAVPYLLTATISHCFFLSRQYAGDGSTRLSVQVS